MPFVSILDLTVFLSDSSSQPSSSVSSDTIPSSQTSVLPPHQPPLNPIPITPSLDTTPVNTPSHTPLQTSVPQQTQTSLTLPLSDTEFPFDITPTHSPPPSSYHIPDPSDINPTLLTSINKPTPSRLKLIPTSIKTFAVAPSWTILFPFLHLVLIFLLNLHYLHLNPLKYPLSNLLTLYRKNQL